MKKREESKKKLGGERNKFDPLNNLDQENMNLEAQIGELIKEVGRLEKHIQNEERRSDKQETKLMENMDIISGVLEHPCPENLIRRDFGRRKRKNKKKKKWTSCPDHANRWKRIE